MEDGGVDRAEAASQRRRLRAAVALGRARLASARGGRIGVAAALSVTLLHALGMIAVREDSGAPAAIDAALRSAATWLAWLGAGPIALAAANDRPGIDRREGVEALAAARGVSPGGLHAARAIAAMQAIALVIGAPAVVLSVAGAGVLASASSGLRLLATGAGLVAFALVTGVTLGLLAALSGRLAGPRGRSLLAALVLIPWALADLAGAARWSIPGALDAFLTLVTGGAS